ncbi:hypothetical protein D9Y32_12165 [Bacillus licheniformis]|nr:hypothetical protein D9Y32_12165 [Bacillus licheniformis]
MPLLKSARRRGVIQPCRLLTQEWTMKFLGNDKITELNWTKTLPKEPIYDMMSGRSKETDKRD